MRVQASPVYRTGVLGPVFFLLAAALAAPLEAQVQRAPDGFGTRGIWGLGYSGVFPDALLGAGVFHAIDGRPWGLFADWKMTTGTLKDSPAFQEDQDINEVRDFRVRTENEWLVFNVGATFALNPDFAIMGGVGLADRTQIIEFIELENEFSYFVENTPESGWKRNIVFGLLFRGGTDLAFRFGLESGPRRVSVGAYLLR